MKKLITLLLLVLFVFTISACNLNEEETDETKPTVYSTLFPQYDIVRALAGDYVNNEFLLDPGVDAHAYEPSPRTVANMVDSDAIIYTSLSMEPWMTTFIEDQTDDGYQLLNLSENIDQHIPEDDHDDDDHDHGEETLDTFELLDRGDDESVMAYVHGEHWHGSLAVDVDDTLSLGANIEDDHGHAIDFDDGYELEVRLHDEDDTDIVSLDHHGDHVHINGESEGTAEVIFSYTDGEDTFYETPAIEVHVGHDHDDDDHNHGEETLDTFELLDRGDDESVTAYVHGEHWHGSVPTIELNDTVSLGANIENADGEEMDLDGEALSLHVDHYGTDTGVVDFAYHGDHVHIEGAQEGHTQVVFEIHDGDEVIFVTPPISVSVAEDVEDADGVADPHIWSAPRNMLQMVHDVEALLVDLVPEHAQSIKDNADEYREKLQSIDADFEHLTNAAQLNTIMLAGHNSLGHLADDYGLELVNPYRGFSSDAEPTSQALTEMIDRMRENNLEYVFSEHVYYPQAADVISEETDTEILYLHNGENLGSDDFNDGMTMLDVFEHNIEQFKIGLHYEE